MFGFHHLKICLRLGQLLLGRNIGLGQIALSVKVFLQIRQLARGLQILFLHFEEIGVFECEKHLTLPYFFANKQIYLFYVATEIGADGCLVLWRYIHGPVHTHGCFEYPFLEAS